MNIATAAKSQNIYSWCHRIHGAGAAADSGMMRGKKKGKAWKEKSGRKESIVDGSVARFSLVLYYVLV